jgi:hypothetical protein
VAAGGRGQEGTAAQSFTSGAAVEVRVTRDTLNGFTNALGPLTSIDLLDKPVNAQSNNNSYLTGSIDLFGNPVAVIARDNYTWNFLNYSLLFSGTVAGSTSGTSNISTSTGTLPTFTSGGSCNYIIQFTSGALQGRSRNVTSSVSSTGILSWTTATASAPGSGDSFEIYQNNNSILNSLSNSNIVFPLAGSYTLLASDSGKTFLVSTGSITLPSPSSGLKYKLVGVNSGIATLVSSGGVPIYLPDSSSTTSLPVGLVTTIEVVCDGTSWFVLNTSGQVITKTATASNQAISRGQGDIRYQGILGYNPVRQGNISTQSPGPVINIGQSVADNTRVKLSVDATDRGNVVLENDNNTFNGINTFNQPVYVPAASLGGQAINLTQADTRYTQGINSVQRGKNTIWIPAGAMTSRVTSGAAIGIVETTYNKVVHKTLDFSQGVAQYAQFKVRMPKSWNGAAPGFGATFVWSATSGTGSVVWSIQVTPIVDGSLDAIFGTAITTTQGVTTGNILTTSETAGFLPTGAYVRASEPTLIFQVSRLITDTLTTTASLHGISLSYITDQANDA